MKLKYDHPHIAPGEEVGIAGLTTVVNGESVDLDDYDVEVFEQERGRPIAEVFAFDPAITLSNGSEQKAARERIEKEREKEAKTEEPEAPEGSFGAFLEEEGEGGET